MSGCALDGGESFEDGETLAETEQPLLTATRTLVGAGGRCLDVAWGDRENGAGVWLWDCNGTAAQEWWIYPNGEIRTKWNKCLSLSGGSGAEGTPLVIWDCHGGSDQKWTPGFDIRSFSGRCLTVSSGGELGSVAVISTCAGSAGQLWSYPWAARFKNTYADRCMYTNGGIGIVGAYIVPATCGDWDSNHYTFANSGEIKTTDGLCLQPSSFSTWGIPTSGAYIRTATCNGSVRQKWKFTGSTESISMTGMCATVDSGSIRMRSCSGSGFQRWAALFPGPE